MKRKHRKIKLGFLLLLIVDIVFIIVSPFLVISFFGFSEDLSESIVILFLFLLFGLFFWFYSKEINAYKKKQAELEERLKETFKYIGSINLQLEEMKKVFQAVDRYPENKKDVQTLFIHTAERILSIINTDWVTLRIIDIKTGNNLHEYFVSRGNRKVEKIKIENKALLNGVCSFGSCSIIKSNQENLSIKAFCILPTEPENKNQEFLINSIVSQLEMLFIIFNSLYYKKG